MRALQIASSLWGGKHFSILPLYKKFTEEYRKEYHLFLNPKEFYKNILDNFDPDFLVVDEGVDENYIKSIRGDREIVKVNDVESSLLINETQYGISIQRS